MRPCDEAQNATLPHGAYEDDNSLVVEDVEIQIEEQADLSLPQMTHHAELASTFDPPCWDDI